MKKRLKLLLALLPALCAAKLARAESCVTVRVERSAMTARRDLYEIDFLNHCGARRTLYWCAENTDASVPPGIACPLPEASAAMPVATSYVLGQRRRFQWALPKGTLIRYHDCPADTLPTLGFGCLPSF